MEEQLSDDNGGFVRNFAHEDGQEPQRIMGYHDAEQVPSFDHLARRFTVCDRWFASVPGPTQPNRQYAICGTSEGRRNNQKGVPTWRAKTIFDHLSERRIGWRYYSHDVAFLRAHVDFRAETNQIKKVKEFYATVRTGKLPRVSWIDPDFGLPILNATRANDDHPDHDVREGQRLVGRIYNALLDAPDKLLDKTLLIVTYDEHGGFYDHVAPPTADDDDPHFRRLGVRVPTLLVSNRVARTTSHEQYDHTSIVKTIMERFLRQPDGSLPDMGKRVASARSLAGEILDEPRAPDTRADLVRVAGSTSDPGVRGPRPDERPPDHPRPAASGCARSGPGRRRAVALPLPASPRSGVRIGPVHTGAI